MNEGVDFVPERGGESVLIDGRAHEGARIVHVLLCRSTDAR